MATKLSRASEKVVREVGGYIVTLTPEGIYLREKGRRLTLGPKSYGALWTRLGWETANAGKVTKVTRGILPLTRG